MIMILVWKKPEQGLEQLNSIQVCSVGIFVEWSVIKLYLAWAAGLFKQVRF